MILNHHIDYKFQPGDNFKYSNEDIELLKTYYIHQTPKSIKIHVKNKLNLF